MAKINEEDINTLRERADMLDVVSGYTRLKKSGANTYKGLCPFHSEKTPSFQVNVARNLFHCFGCQEGGDIYTFVEKAESLPFREAVEWLARRTGFDLRYEEMRPGERKAAGFRARLVAANEEAMEFFHRALVRSPDALEARRYLERRGFTRDVAERWKLGYAPGRDALTRHLLAKGFTEVELTRGDLARRSDRDGSLYDSFRERIVFPTWNLQGDVVGFGARELPSRAGRGPKYLNTAETPLFAKSRLMYGLHRAKSAIARSNVAVVVEGYTDVIALHEAGVEEAVATNGVALGEGHFELLKKFAERVVLMLDADTAGRGAMERSYDVHHRIGLEVLVAPLPDGRDPAELVQQDGVASIRKAIEEATPIVTFKIDEILSRAPLDTPEARSRAVREVAGVLSPLSDPISRSQYVLMTADRIGIDAGAVERALADERISAGGERDAIGTKHDDRRLPGQVKVEREALLLLLTRPSESRDWVARIGETDFTSRARREVFRAAMRRLEGGSAEERLSPDAMTLYAELSVDPGGTEEAYPAAGIEEVFARLKVLSLERQIKERRKELHGINPLEEAELHDRVFTELVKLEAQRRDLLKRLRESV